MDMDVVWGVVGAGRVGASWEGEDGGGGEVGEEGGGGCGGRGRAVGVDWVVGGLGWLIGSLWVDGSGGEWVACWVWLGRS